MKVRIEIDLDVSNQGMAHVDMISAWIKDILHANTTVPGAPRVEAIRVKDRDMQSGACPTCASYNVVYKPYSGVPFDRPVYLHCHACESDFDSTTGERLANHLRATIVPMRPPVEKDAPAWKADHLQVPVSPTDEALAQCNESSRGYQAEYEERGRTMREKGSLLTALDGHERAYNIEREKFLAAKRIPTEEVLRADDDSESYEARKSARR